MFVKRITGKFYANEKSISKKMESFVGRAANKWFMYRQKKRVSFHPTRRKFIAQLKVSFLHRRLRS